MNAKAKAPPQNNLESPGSPIQERIQKRKNFNNRPYYAFYSALRASYFTPTELRRTRRRRTQYEAPKGILLPISYTSMGPNFAPIFYQQ